jgi:SAM-dependent methyltransferase
LFCCRVNNDQLALAELNRILRKDGRLLIMVPLIEGWDRTYENPDITNKRDKELHFGQYDHLRYYGRDFRDRLKNAGFIFYEFTAFGADCTEYGLLRGDKIFICTKESPSYA